MLSRPRTLALGLSLSVLWILIAYHSLGTPGFEIGPGIGGTKADSRLSKEEFIEAAMTAAVEDDFDDTHIAEMCSSQEWDSSVVFDCRGNIGGIGNIRQELLHCMRYSISAGAGLIMPVISLRSEDNLKDLESGTASMSYLFDQERFVSRLKTACPMMTIYNSVEELKKVGPVTETEAMDARKLPHWPLQPAFEARTRVEQIKAPAGQITLVPFQHIWQYFPICHDKDGFANSFGNLIPFREDVHRLAATALYEMYSQYHVPIDPSVTTTSRSVNTFLGVHLRTSNDILDYWSGYDEQSKYYLSRIDASPSIGALPVVYIASGNATSIIDFGAQVQPRTVLTKHHLLSGADTEELSQLTWDQQALVDYLILIRSGYFLGMADSTFAWTLAIKRRITSHSGTCYWARAVWKSRIFGAAFRDEFSDLLGNRAFGWEYRMWP